MLSIARYQLNLDQMLYEHHSNKHRDKHYLVDSKHLTLASKPVSVNTVKTVNNQQFNKIEVQFKVVQTIDST